MPTLFGEPFSRSELLRRLGDITQVGGVQRIVLDDGPERGVEAALCRTGNGLAYVVLLDRGLDIGPADWRGIPLAWRSPTGFAQPAYHEPEGAGWLRTFGGGLLTTCGLSQVGSPNVDQGEALGLHGRVSHLPARAVWVDGAWDGDEYEFWVQGRVVEAAVFGEHLSLTRRVSARLGEDRIRIKDVVENRGFAPAPHQILYHLNLGFPLVDEQAEVRLPTRRATPRDADAEAGLREWDCFGPPDPAWREQVFFHDLEAGQDGWVVAAVRNPRRGLQLTLRYRQAELPRFIQWKQCGAGTYVLGLEPSNGTVLGRAADRAAGLLQFLQPGERREYRLELSVEALTT